ncbi:DUF6597 domain-containing transcriptional factor [Nonomuraea candida]|uniref:DUF6597 domain-containing transcriptional factor n=1 Tax=Nonomuraea candida TaxID=359159 RepID=UPI0005B8011C|nr:DUF6597 domain-containing transcriptional factor [Nonomuraea candida]
MYEERPPSPDLADRIACGWHRTSGTTFTQLVVPDACVDLIWGPSGLFVAGPDTGPMPTSVGAGDTLVGVRFRPGAAGDLFGLPLKELRDRRVPLTELPALRALVSDLTDRPALTGVEARLRALQSAVRRRLAGGAGPDPVAPAIAAALGRGRTVAEVAWDLGYSERQLQRRSVASFGYAPKTLQRIVRFQHALRLARAGVPQAEVAVVAGYTDQAHLAHDVKRLSGVPLSSLVSPVRVRELA